MGSYLSHRYLSESVRKSANGVRTRVLHFRTLTITPRGSLSVYHLIIFMIYLILVCSLIRDFFDSILASPYILRGVHVDKGQTCVILGREPELQSRYYVHFQTLGKGMNPLIPLLMGWFGLVSLFNATSTFLDNLMPKPSF